MEEKEKIKKIVNFFFELLHLKRVPRSGLTTIGIKDIDSVAEHVFVAAQIAYVLGKMEEANAEKAALMCLFHDNGEARVFDINLLQSIYLTDKGVQESKALSDQIENLPGGQEIKGIYQEFEDKKTLEAIVARDADKLELAIQAKHYLERGEKDAKIWIDKVRSSLKTESSKKLLNVIENSDPNGWWKEIPEIKEKLEKNWQD
ncbi:HD domain-containing protein [Candidatus Parcubacteria bacterium]|nr:HD domain-containing protein [Candidatus Parcubacteria bacterium]